MGKAQKVGKRKQRRHNPVRVPDSHLGQGVKLAEQTSDKKGQVIPVLQKLDSPDVEDRRWACAAVTNLIQNDASTRRLLQSKGVVEKLIMKLSDTADDVVAESAGSLRNLAVDGGYDMCAHMFNKNILAPLKAFIPKITAALQENLGPSPPKSFEGLRGRIFEFSENVVTLFWCLSETSNKALNAINDAALTPFLMAFLISKDKIPIRTVVAAAQCLYVLSDDNDPTLHVLSRVPTYIPCLLAIASSSDPTQKTSDDMAVDKPLDDEQQLALKVLACGILMNLSASASAPASLPTEIERTLVLPLLVPVLGYSIQDAANRVQELMTVEYLEAQKDAQIGFTPKNDHQSPTEIEIEKIESHLRTVVLSLEIMTGVCAKLPDPEPGMEDDELEEDSEDTADEDAEDEDELGDAPIQTDEDISKEVVPAGTLSLIASLTQPLISLAQPTSLSFFNPSPHPPTTSALGSIHIRALECLNNLFIGINPEETDLPENAASQAVDVWRQVWVVLGAVGKQSEWTVGTAHLEVRKEVWEIAVGVLWGLARICKGVLAPEAEQVTALIEFCDSSKDELIKVKVIGTLGCIAQRGDAVEANKVIATYLFTYLTAPLSNPSVIPYPEATLHAASSLIDIYADEDKPYDVNWRQAQWTTALAGTKDRVKRAARAIDRKREGGKELRLFADEVLANVTGFVQYRRKLKI